MAKILLIDDDAALTKMVGDWLQFEKHDVKIVHSGIQGWAELEAGDFELAVVDWDMPDVNGIDLVKRYRAAGGGRPLIMLTGHTSIEDKEKGFDCGANDYITKPFHMKELSARIRAALRNVSAAPQAVKSLGTGNEEILQQAGLVGTSLAGRYEFKEIIGEGGAAVVLKAWHPDMERWMAVKVLQSDQLNEQQVARFRQEARAISRMDHPNIIRIYDFGVTENKHPFMVMEYIEGKSMEAILLEEDHLSLQRGLHILCQVADALKHAHEHGILHRDIKPGNIMIKKGGDQADVVKILDFGLAKLVGDAQKQNPQLTQTHMIIGSPLYMSPEQVRGGQTDARTDIYQMGCIIFETLTGYQPIVGDTVQEIIIKHLEEAPYSYKEVQPNLKYPPELERLTARCLEKVADNRIQSMKELKEELSKILASLDSQIYL
jgi:serine/threonine-protein kinase